MSDEDNPVEFFLEGLDVWHWFTGQEQTDASLHPIMLDRAAQNIAAAGVQIASKRKLIRRLQQEAGLALLAEALVAPEGYGEHEFWEQQRAMQQRRREFLRAITKGRLEEAQKYTWVPNLKSGIWTPLHDRLGPVS